MAGGKQLFGSGIFKDNQGNIVAIQGLSQNDVTKIKTGLSDIETLKNQVKSINAGQKQIALKDYYTNEDHKSEMAVGVYYMVPFNEQGQYLQWDEATGKPKVDQGDSGVSDTKLHHFQVVYKNSDDVVNKLGQQDVQASFQNVAMTNVANRFTEENVFAKDITIEVTQDVSSLADNKATTAKFVRELVTQKVTESGHLVGKWSDTTPEEGTLNVNELVFYAAKDLIA